MSWNTAKKRFQRDLDKYPEHIRKILLQEQAKYLLPTFTHLRHIPKKDELRKIEDVGYAPGDMVYVTEGDHKGKVTSVLLYSAESDTFLLTDALRKRVVPRLYWPEGMTSHLMDYPESIPREHVKLAAKDRDENGKVLYVVADSVVMRDKYYDENHKRWLPRRFVKHHDNIEIPWPRPPQAPEDDVLLTPESVVHEKTWELQTIAKPPFPLTILRELRNPYSEFKKKSLTEAQASKLNGVEMPLSVEQKLYLARQAEKPKKRLQPLSPEIKDFIGAKMAEHINKIESPELLLHIDAMARTKIPDFQKTMNAIKQAALPTGQQASDSSL